MLKTVFRASSRGACGGVQNWRPDAGIDTASDKVPAPPQARGVQGPARYLPHALLADLGHLPKTLQDLQDHPLLHVPEGLLPGRAAPNMLLPLLLIVLPLLIGLLILLSCVAVCVLLFDLALTLAPGEQTWATNLSIQSNTITHATTGCK